MITQSELWSQVKAYPTTHAWCVTVISVMIVLLVMGL